MKKIKLFSLHIFLLLSLSSNAETNDCSHPQHPVKKLICTDASFNDLYKQMTFLVDKMIADPELGQGLEAAQDSWFGITSQICEFNDECFKKTFSARFNELKERADNFEREKRQVQTEVIKFSPGMFGKNQFDNAEIILISGYSAFAGISPNREDTGVTGMVAAMGAGVSFGNNSQSKSSQPKVNVLVDRPGANVVLILSTHEKVKWNIQATPSTKITAVFISSPSPQVIASGVNVYAVNLPYAYESENANFRGILLRLNEWFGIKAVNLFKGEFKLQPKIEIHSMDAPRKEWSLNGVTTKKNQSKMAFDLPAPNFQFTKWSFTGPLASSADSLPLIAESNFVKIDKKIFRVTNRRLEVINVDTQEAHFVESSSGFPKITEWRDLTFDTTRHLIVFVGSGSGGENFLFRYNPKTDQWIDFQSIKREDVLSISYDATDDNYIGWQPYARLLLISPGGVILQKKDLVGLMPSMDSRSYTGQTFKHKVLSQGNRVAVIAYQGKTVRRIWHYDLDTQETSLTYQFNSSFDCGDAATQAQKFICSDAGLAKKDVTLNQYFNQAIALEGEGSTLKSEQALWSMNGLTKCTTLSCLNNAYDERIKYFASILHIETFDKIENILNLTTENPNKNLAAGAEVIVVSGYEPTKSSPKEFRSNNAVEADRAKVIINRPNSKVILVLSSSDPVTWLVEATPATNLIGIIVASAKQASVISNNQSVQYAGILSETNRLGYATEINSKNFSDILAGLNKVLGIKKVDAFRGSYTLPREILIDHLDKMNDQLTLSGPIVRKIQTDFKFNLIDNKYKRVSWSLMGPEDNTYHYYLSARVALPKKGDDVYRALDHHLEMINPFLDKPINLLVPSGFPEIHWPNDVAFDTKRNLAVFSAGFGDGLLYRYSASSQKWIDFFEYKNISCATLSYDEKTDRYICWAGQFDGGNLIFFSGDGKFLSKLNVTTLLEGFGRLSDIANNQVPILKIVSNGNELGLLFINGGQVEYIWYLNLETKASALTYKRDSMLKSTDSSSDGGLINQTIRMR